VTEFGGNQARRRCREKHHQKIRSDWFGRRFPFQHRCDGRSPWGGDARGRHVEGATMPVFVPWGTTAGRGRWTGVRAEWQQSDERRGPAEGGRRARFGRPKLRSGQPRNCRQVPRAGNAPRRRRDTRRRGTLIRPLPRVYGVACWRLEGALGEHLHCRSPAWREGDTNASFEGRCATARRTYGPHFQTSTTSSPADALERPCRLGASSFRRAGRVQKGEEGRAARSSGCPVGSGAFDVYGLRHGSVGTSASGGPDRPAEEERRKQAQPRGRTSQVSGRDMR